MISTSDPLPSSAQNEIFFRNYWDILGGVLFALLAFWLNAHHQIYFATFFAATSIAFLSVTVAEIAEILAQRLEEPYGSFVLTFSAVAVEIILLFTILMQATHASTQALDTVKGGIISAVIVDMNVLLGLAVFIGGLAFKEQEHNGDTSSTYTTILLVASAALLVPSILSHTAGSIELERACIIISVVLFLFYIIIYIFQTKTHSHFFKATARSRIFRIKRRIKDKETQEEIEVEDDYIFDKLSTPLNFVAIFGVIAVIGFTAEVFAHNGLVVFQEHGISAGLAGLIIAIISVAPEIFTAIKAAQNDQMQRVVNIAMGASVVSIMLAVPMLMLLSHLNGIPLTLDFNTLQVGALILTIVLAWKTTDDGQTNYFEGISHLMFFLSYAVIASFY
ncbi:MAG: sodium:proton exchanger [Sulfuricurvum sp. PC08-66]|nr:MAG: sodium:proton exchanger [Sulfuricurvum sp. PC08-66]